MKSIKHIINLLSSKVAQKNAPANAALSSNEMDHLFGGKPEEVVSEHTYWWFEEDETLLHAKPGGDPFSSLS